MSLRIITHEQREIIIPDSHRWVAVDDNTYDGGDDIPAIGYGPTERDAIRDLLDHMDTIDEIQKRGKTNGHKP